MANEQRDGCGRAGERPEQQRRKNGAYERRDVRQQDDGRRRQHDAVRQPTRLVALRFRVSRSVRGGRLVAAVACAALIPVTLMVPAIAALSLLAAVWIALHAYELIWWRAARTEIRTQREMASVSSP